MTTILLDVKNKKIYADKRTTYSYDDYGFDSYEDGNLKLHKEVEAQNTTIFTGSGDIDNVEAFRNGTSPTSLRDTKAFRIEYNKEGNTFTVVEASPAKIKVLSLDYLIGRRFYWKKYSYLVTDYLTAGSGSSYAIGAYLGGHPPERIIPDIVAQLDIGTSPDQNVFNFKTGKFE